MKRFLTLTSLVLFVLATVSSCGKKCKEPSGKTTTQNRVVADFENINVKGDFTVILVQDTVKVLQITGDENFMENIKSEVSGSTLEIREEGKCSGDKIALVIHSKNFEEISLAGNFDVKTQDKLKLNDVELNFAGLVNADLDINAHDMKTSTSGKSTIKLKGQASQHDVSLAGEGQLDAFDFVAGTYKVSTAGSSECKINVLSELTAKSSGNGNIEYKGNPTKINQDISGNGKIQKAQ